MGMVRITSGRLRGRAVETPDGEGTRPLLSRLRKSLADVLRPRLPDARVLDLFGGSGAVAFELLSNGAREATLVELDDDAARRIEANASRLGVRANVHHGDALKTIPVLGRRGEQFDVVVVAPPYGTDLQQRALDALQDQRLLAEGGIVVSQRDHRDPPARPRTPLVLTRTRTYGRTAFDFYQEPRR